MPSCNHPAMGILQEEIKKDHKCRIIHPTHAIQSKLAAVSSYREYGNPVA